MIDDILVSNREGRNLEGFDQLYADPEVKNALQVGNDTIARAYIRDKLCTLGLMNVSLHEWLFSPQERFCDPENRRVIIVTENFSDLSVRQF